MLAVSKQSSSAHCHLPCPTRAGAKPKISSKVFTSKLSDPVPESELQHIFWGTELGAQDHRVCIVHNHYNINTEILNALCFQNLGSLAD